MADKAERGFHGDHREGFGAGRVGRGAGRFDRGGGRFDRGAGRADRGGDRFSWRRGDIDNDNNKANYSASSDTSRWEAAAAAELQSSGTGGVWVKKNQKSSGSGGGSSSRQAPAMEPTPASAHHNQRPATKSQVPPSKSGDSCLICKAVGHLPVRCPQAFCERCNKLGHLASVCVEFLPWECIAPMCAFQARGQGFYYIHDYCSAKQAKERSCNVVITVLEGNPTVKDMNDAFFLYLGKTWRCFAKLIGPGVFLMRFPNTREVDKACYSDRMTMRPCGTVVRVTQWEQNVGAKGVLEKAWVKVGNIPPEKRCERNVAFVSSLVGIPLEINMSTLHRPDSVKVKLGCRNVDEIPPVAESVLGDHFYDFTYEVDQILVRDPDREKNKTTVAASRGEPSPKKQKKMGVDEAPIGSSSNGKNDLGGKSSVGKQCLPNIPESPQSVNSDSSNHNTLLIHSMEQEALAAAGISKDNVDGLSQVQNAINIDDARVVKEGAASSYADVVRKSIQVTEMEGPFGANEEHTVEYSVQSPGSAMEQCGEVIPTPPLLSENVLRFSVRTMQTNFEKVEDKARAASKKRDLEGLLKKEDRSELETGATLLKENAKSMMRICASAYSEGALE